MNNEMKLITALCEALGFSVEVERNYDERKEPESMLEQYHSGIDYPRIKGRALVSDGGLYYIDENGKYTSRLVEPILSYKLIKGEV